MNIVTAGGHQTPHTSSEQVGSGSGALELGLPENFENEYLGSRLWSQCPKQFPLLLKDCHVYCFVACGKSFLQVSEFFLILEIIRGVSARHSFTIVPFFLSFIFYLILQLKTQLALQLRTKAKNVQIKRIDIY